jgi:hypothetical protein
MIFSAHVRHEVELNFKITGPYSAVSLKPLKPMIVNDCLKYFDGFESIFETAFEAAKKDSLMKNRGSKIA